MSEMWPPRIGSDWGHAQCIVFRIARNAFHIAKPILLMFAAALDYHTKRELREATRRSSLLLGKIPAAFLLVTSEFVTHFCWESKRERGDVGRASRQLCPLMVTEKWHLRASHSDIIPPKGRRGRTGRTGRQLQTSHHQSVLTSE